MTEREREALLFVNAIGYIGIGLFRHEANNILRMYGLDEYPLIADKEESSNIELSNIIKIARMKND